MTDRIVHAVHQVPLRHIPKGGRIPRLDWFGVRTPVRVREAAPSDLTLAVTVNVPYEGTIPFHGLDGCLWRESLVTDWWEDRRGATRPVTPDEFAAFVENRVDPLTCRSPLRFDLLHTPLQALGSVRGRGWFLRRSAMLEPGLSREVLHDGSAAAIAAIQSWFDANVRFAGGKVLIRTREPLALFMPGAPGDFGQPSHDGPHWEASTLSWAGMQPSRFYRLDRLDEAHAFESSLPPHLRLVADRPELVGVTIHDGSFFQDDDIHIQVNRLPLMVEECLRLVLGRLRKRKQDAFLDRQTGDLRARLAAMEPWRERAMIGAIAPAQSVDAVAACEEVIEGMRAAEGGLRLPQDWAQVLLGIPHKFATCDLPRLQAAGHVAAPSQEDDEAMATL